MSSDDQHAGLAEELAARSDDELTELLIERPDLASPTPQGTRVLAQRALSAASLALACLMLPIVVRSTEEMLRLVPNSLREASAALGTRTWKTTVSVVLPAALAGITSGCLLAVARAAGETAPVVFTIGFVTTTNWSMTGQNTTLSAQIYSQLQNGGSLATQLAWGSAVTLVGIVLVLTLAARGISRRFSIG